MNRLPRPSHPRRLVAVGAVLAAAAAGASGCAPEAEPEPTPSAGFSSEEEALEAARATYEGYVEATNGLKFEDPSTSEAVFAWLEGDALSDEREIHSTAYAKNYKRTGASDVTLVSLASEADTVPLLINACVDNSQVEVVDSSGVSILASERLLMQPVSVSLVPADTTSTKLKITSMSAREGDPLCDEDE